MSRKTATFVCNICEVPFPSSGALASHKEDRHVLGRFLCIWCGKVFPLKMELREHGRHCTSEPVESGTEYYRASQPERKRVEEAFGVRHQTAAPMKHRTPFASFNNNNYTTQNDRQVGGGMYTTFSVAPANHSTAGSSQQTYEGSFYPQNPYALPGPEGMQHYAPTHPQNSASSSSSASASRWIEEQQQPREQPGSLEYHQAQAAAQYMAGLPVSEEEEQQRYWAYGYPPASGA